MDWLRESAPIHGRHSGQRQTEREGGGGGGGGGVVNLSHKVGSSAADLWQVQAFGLIKWCASRRQGPNLGYIYVRTRCPVGSVGT